MIRTNIIEKTLSTFGKDNQIDMMIEECSEVIQALCKHKRDLPSNVEEELADLHIMYEQMRLIFRSDIIDAYDTSKIIRLDKRLKEIERNGK